MISCDKATYYSDISQYKKLSITEKVKFKSHLMSCKPCSDYHIQNKIISETIKKVSFANANDSGLSKDKKAQMQDEIKKNI